MSQIAGSEWRTRHVIEIGKRRDRPQNRRTIRLSIRLGISTDIPDVASEPHELLHGVRLDSRVIR